MSPFPQPLLIFTIHVFHMADKITVYRAIVFTSESQLLLFTCLPFSQRAKHLQKGTDISVYQCWKIQDTLRQSQQELKVQLELD